MIEIQHPGTANLDDTKINRYYRFHSLIYDATRWSFLFGRDDLLDSLPRLPAQPRILEIGCGTGRNIRQIKDCYPNAEIVGIDLSAPMLKVAANKFNKDANVELIHSKYDSVKGNLAAFDLILCSYSLSMFNEKTENTIRKLSAELNRGGYVAVVDFHTSPFAWFRQWMNMNHVDINRHLLPLLKKRYRSNQSVIKKAYFGLWSYFQFIGQPQDF